MNIRKVVIPVAGPGTGLLPATKSQPKEMLPVGRKPVVQYVVEEMIEQDIINIMFITGRDNLIIAYRSARLQNCFYTTSGDFIYTVSKGEKSI